MYFAIKQTSYLILSGAYLLVKLVSSVLLMCFRSCLIASGLVWPSILCHFMAVALTGLWAILLSWNLLLEVVNIN